MLSFTGVLIRYSSRLSDFETEVFCKLMRFFFECLQFNGIEKNLSSELKERRRNGDINRTESSASVQLLGLKNGER